LENKFTFNEILEAGSVGLSGSGSITIATIFLSMLVSLLTGLFISYIYRRTFQGVLFQKSFAMAIVLVTLITTMVIMVISGNLILSLGMVGALSIVRFRAAVKDPLDIVYLFWGVAAGIANGVAYYSVSIIASIFIGVSLIYYSKIPSRLKSKLLVVNCNSSVAPEVKSLITKQSKNNVIRSQSEKNELNELVFEITTYETDEFYEKIREIDGVQQIRLLNYSTNN
jgi:uncharacterized membrane protein YhiD involved in acid resistance|tara:strand:+ start:1135 stop:1812 length:678 start_codon:yes stop_codon:yes gene_type:complete